MPLAAAQLSSPPPAVLQKFKPICSLSIPLNLSLPARRLTCTTTHRAADPPLPRSAKPADETSLPDPSAFLNLAGLSALLLAAAMLLMVRPDALLGVEFLGLESRASDYEEVIKVSEMESEGRDPLEVLARTVEKEKTAAGFLASLWKVGLLFLLSLLLLLFCFLPKLTLIAETDQILQQSLARLDALHVFRPRLPHLSSVQVCPLFPRAVVEPARPCHRGAALFLSLCAVG